LLVRRHGSFWTAHGQWYYSANDQSHSIDVKHPNNFRDTIITYVHYEADGKISPVVIDDIGVGEYKRGMFIEAENFFAASGTARKVHLRGNHAVGSLRSGATLVYPHIRGEPSSTAHDRSVKLQLRYHYSSLHRNLLVDAATCGVDVHAYSAAGPTLGRILLPPTSRGAPSADNDSSDVVSFQLSTLSELSLQYSDTAGSSIDPADLSLALVFVGCGDAEGDGAILDGLLVL